MQTYQCAGRSSDVGHGAPTPHGERSKTMCSLALQQDIASQGGDGDGNVALGRRAMVRWW